MDPINRGLIFGGVILAGALAATMMLGGFLEHRAADEIDETYAPGRETTVDENGWPSVEVPSPVRSDKPAAQPPG